MVWGETGCDSRRSMESLVKDSKTEGALGEASLGF
jgi:hypothetical protein